MLLERPGRNDSPPLVVSIRVVFDCHVVTEEDNTVVAKGVADDPAYWVDSGGLCRVFNEARYQRSLGLPDLLRSLTDGKTKCYVASDDNYMVCQRTTKEGITEFYQIYFDIYRAPTGHPRLVMYVQSAYVKDIPTAADRQHEKPFATICAQTIGAIQKKKKGPRNKAQKQR